MVLTKSRGGKIKNIFYVFAMIAVLGLQVQSNSARADEISICDTEVMRESMVGPGIFLSVIATMGIMERQAKPVSGRRRRKTAAGCAGAESGNSAVQLRRSAL